MKRYFVVKDKNGKTVSAVSENDADGESGKLHVSVVVPGDQDKQEVSQDEYEKQKKSKNLQ